MSSRPKAKTEDVLPPNHDPNAESAAYEEPEDTVDIDKIRSILSSHDISGGKIRLDRKGPFDTAYQYIASMPIEQFDIDHIKKTFGGGDYRAKTHKADGRMYKGFDFSIDYRFKGALDEQDIKGLARNPQVAQQVMVPDRTGDMIKIMELSSRQQENSMALIMKMMMDSQERQMAMMQQMFTNAKPQQTDFATSITPILVAMISKTTASPVSEAIAMMKELKTLSAGDDKQSDKEEPSFVEKLISAVGPLLIGAAQRPMPANGHNPVQQTPGGNTAQVGNQGYPRQTIPGPQMVDVPQQPPDMQQLQIGMFVQQLIRAAERGSDPALYYDLIADNLEDNQLAELREVLAGDDWHQKLFGGQLPVDQHKEWFEELRQLILSPEPVAHETHENLESQPATTESIPGA